MMKIMFYSPLWGYESEPFCTYCEQVAASGYDGIELNLAVNPEEAEKQLHLLDSFGLDYVAQHSGTVTPVFEDHCEHYRASLERIAAFKPRLINSHTGRDYFSFEQNLILIDIAAEVGTAFGVQVVHETHRGRFPYSASMAYAYMQQCPGLRLTADFSHWCCVSESFLQDQEKSVQAAIERSDHIHARIGHDQGPQVNDPRAPEWTDTVELYLGWWRRIIEAHAAKGSAALTITTEFGPPPYTTILPYTMQAVADPRELNLYILSLLRERYKRSD